jgi:hypothetical protein
VGGGKTANFIIAPDPSAPLRVFLRNGATPNHVVLSSRGWRADLALSPGEERLVEVPIASDAVPLDVTADNGFRPSDVDPSTSDDRYLGVWLEMR